MKPNENYTVEWPDALEKSDAVACPVERIVMCDEHDDAYKAEISRLQVKLNGMRGRLERRDKRLEESERRYKEEVKALALKAEERKHLIDVLSAENGRLKRKLKRQK